LDALSKDPDAVAADLPDLTPFMLATGQRIGQCLAVLWMEVDVDRGQIQVTSIVIRRTGHGLVRKRDEVPSRRADLESALLGRRGPAPPSRAWHPT